MPLRNPRKYRAEGGRATPPVAWGASKRLLASVSSLPREQLYYRRGSHHLGRCRTRLCSKEPQWKNRKTSSLWCKAEQPWLR